MNQIAGKNASKTLWTTEALLDATGGRLVGSPPTHITGISIDTRTLEPGALYVAIRGDRLDGHDYVEAAFAAGASLAMVANDWPGLSDGARLSGPVIVVEETLDSMGAIGRTARDRCAGKIIAVTGSVGKTGTKEALRHCLAPQGRTHAAEKSFNNHWGVPLTLGRMPADTEYGIFEIGMNHPGEIRPLVKMVRPHIAIITTVEPVHLGYFESLEEIADAKAEIFEGVEPRGVAILNRDNQFYERLAQRARDAGIGEILSFGARDDNRSAADMQLVDVRLEPTGSDVTAMFRGQEIRYRLSIPGRHIVQNSLGILLAIAAADADIEQAAQALHAISPQKGRGKRTLYEVQGGRVAVVDESYNANPASMRAALESIAGTPKSDFPRRIAVLGDMLELGEASEDLHVALVQNIEDADVDLVFASGPFMERLFEKLPASRRGAYGRTSEEIRTALIDAVRPGDLVMVKGSLGSRMGPLVDALNDHLIEA